MVKVEKSHYCMLELADKKKEQKYNKLEGKSSYNGPSFKELFDEELEKRKEEARQGLR